jgi:hypothetical protein
MAYGNTFSTMHALRQLADVAGPFPIKARHVILAAERYGFGYRVMVFLEQFEPEEIFSDRAEFIRRCKDVKHAGHTRQSATQQEAISS